MASRCLPAIASVGLLAAACHPYSEDRVRIKVNGEVTLAGTFSIPDGDGPFPAVVLISGSGLQTRDSNLWGFRVFRKIADHLSSSGIAVLRCDDRGYGASTGDPSARVNNTLDFAEDVLAQVAYLKTRPEVAPTRIGLLGQSEGALVAAMVDARSDDIEFAILVAGPGVPVRQVLDDQLAATLTLKGVDGAAIEARLELWQRIWKALEQGEELAGLRHELFEQSRGDFPLLAAGQQTRYGSADAYAERIVRKEFGMLETEWGRFLVTYDPRVDQARMDARVLALYGAKDTQVAAGINATALENTFREVGKDDFRIVILKDANHLFQVAKTGAVAEYATLPREFVPGYLQAIEAWVLREPLPRDVVPSGGRAPRHRREGQGDDRPGTVTIPSS